MSRFHRYFKKCEEFALCAEVSDGNVVEVEDASERYTLYQIVVKGSGRMGKIFENDYIVGDVNGCLLYTSPSPRDSSESRIPSSA